jgi:hypothetical protein
MNVLSRRLLGVIVLVACLGCAAQAAPPDPDRLRTAKALFFDGKYVEARQIWEQARAAGGSDAQTARFWIARCSEKTGESERALREYGEYLSQGPVDAAFADEARTSRIGLATRLYKDGRKQHLDLVLHALKDPSRTVRYYAALQLAALGPDVGQAAVPVLKTILAQEKDPDLTDRAKLALLRVDPDALSDDAPVLAGRTREARWLKIRILEHGAAKPSVSINVPVALADLVFKNLPDEARTKLKGKGYDAENFWQKLKGLGPTQIIDIVGDDGGRIQIWLE